MRCLIGVDRVDIIGAKDEHCFTINIYFGSAILAIENAIALFHGHRKVLALVVDAAFANSENDTGLRLLLRIRSDVEATCRGFMSFVLLNDVAITMRLLILSRTSSPLTHSPVNALLRSFAG